MLAEERRLLDNQLFIFKGENGSSSFSILVAKTL
jgi:hypothetical protein